MHCLNFFNRVSKHQNLVTIDNIPKIFYLNWYFPANSSIDDDNDEDLVYTIHCEKNVKCGVFPGSYFPVFSPNTGKYRPEKTPYLDTFHAVIPLTFFFTRLT